MQFSALWDSLPYSSPSTPDRSGAPLGGERFRGSRLDSCAILAYWCTLLQALLGRAIALRLCKYRDVVRPLHRPLHYRVRGRGRRKNRKKHGSPRSLTDGNAMLMSPSKGETAVRGCHCPRDMAVRMREVMARPWVGVSVPLALIYW